MSADAPTSWTASTTTPWITLLNTSGSTPGSLQFDISTGGLDVGAKNGSITLQAAGKTFIVPVDLNIMTLNVTKLLPNPNRPVVYGINTALAGEGFCPSPRNRCDHRQNPPCDADRLRSHGCRVGSATGRLYIANNGYSQSKVIDVNAWVEFPSLNLGENVQYLETVTGGRLAR